MDNNIAEINELIKQFSKLPGLGPKSAKRIILKLINNKESMVKPLAKSLAKVYKSVVRCADWVIDMGPDGGDKGGDIIACGTPEQIADNLDSYTGQYLKKVLLKHDAK